MLASAADMAVDLHVVGRVGQDHGGDVALHEARHVVRAASVPVEQPVLAE